MVTELKVQEEGEARGERHGSRLTYRGVTRHTHTGDMGSVAVTKVDSQLKLLSIWSSLDLNLVLTIIRKWCDG